MPKPSRLTTRQYERYDVELVAELIVSEAHRQQVRFSTTSSALSPCAVSVMTIDLSGGGLGIRSELFLPRMCEGTVNILAPEHNQGEGVTPPHRETLFAQRVKVQWSTLTDHRPTYAIGLKFLDHDLDLIQRIAGFMDRVDLLMSNRTEVET